MNKNMNREKQHSRLGWIRPPKGDKQSAAIWLAALMITALLLPAALVHRSGSPQDTPVPAKTASPAKTLPAPESAKAQPNIRVYLSGTGEIETLPLESYVVGVLAAEMPAKFEMEALKAQAIASRTYIVRRLVTGDTSGVPVQGADVTDTVENQAYISQEKLSRDWSSADGRKELAKLQRAVMETEGIVMTYKGEPIMATFFSSSNGYTENSEDYWQQKIPYLRSVTSPWDQEIAANYKETVSITISDFDRLLNLPRQTVQTITGTQGESPIHIVSTTAGHRIKEIYIGGMLFTGKEVRERLGLRSTEFTWRITSGSIEITTYGNGHGVGMSQWGANGMAQQGYTATQILQHYYTGIEFEHASKLLENLKNKSIS
ncbi:stage II sporulation protein D [Paenibacillus sediminis]|uniref:Stage II sporulation protein D n=1 Tax=Paenibacillus sediminis TaxID=664909 RepID=A0ABS4H2E5_9BACL|nr:stage II sporulation protein D [Paenibacillus sediminis]MBP1936693.1 stage II sporulation protein D [Paenibacillus sediminis]